jgi:uncharacterized protein YbjT (DUF2867 family)
MRGLILVTGGTGKTGRRLIAELRKKGVPFRVASRGVTISEEACPFDWTQPGSWTKR